MAQAVNRDRVNHFASLPGGIRFDFITYMKFSNPFRIRVIAAAVSIIAYLITIAIGDAISTLGPSGRDGTSAAQGVFYVVRIVAFFVGIWALNGAMVTVKKMTYWAREMCLTPAIVVSRTPDRIAVYTDLARTTTALWPSITIIEADLTQLGGRPLRVGDHVPVVSGYFGDLDNDHWDKIVPVPVSHLTSNPQVIAESVSRLDRDEGGTLWAALDHYLAQVHTPRVVGTYRFGPFPPNRAWY
jgi:hypothetical protein